MEPLPATQGVPPPLPPSTPARPLVDVLLIVVGSGVLLFLLLFSLSRFRAFRRSVTVARRKRSAALQVDPWFEAGRRAGPAADSKGPDSIEGGEDDHGRSGGMP
jgi:hypothetical protein